MRKIALVLGILFVLSLFLVFFSCFSFLNSGSLAYGSTSSGMDVQGILWDNTTWTAANSPYIITGTVEIPSNATLTIEPGVTITVDPSKPNLAPLFLVNGTIIAQGNANDKIVFDGGGHASFFTLNNDSAYLGLNYCTIKNGNSLMYQGHGSFCLYNSLLDTLCYESIIKSPQDIYIVNSTFANTASLYISSAPTIYMQNDLFTRNAGPILIMGDGSAVISNSSFTNTNGCVLQLAPEGSGANPTIDAANNYWGTTNTTIIESMLNDANSSVPITYQPILQTASTNAPPDSFNLTIYTIGDGTVTPSNATYAAYSTVNLSASSASGWSFSGWSGDASGSNKNITITMDSNKTITATFVSNPTSTTTETAAVATISIIIVVVAAILLRQKIHSQFTKVNSAKTSTLQTKK